MNTRAGLLPVGIAFASLGALPWILGPVAQSSTRTIDQRQSADPAGTVEIINVAGAISVMGWDQREVSVTGRISDRVERVELSSSGRRTVVRVILPRDSFPFGGDGSAYLTIHVPTHSGLEVSLVSSSLAVSGVSGPQRLRSISGDISSDGGGAAHIGTVSGQVHLTVPNATAAQVESASGDVTVNGAGDDVSISTVSGGGHLQLGTLRNFSLHTVSGDFDIDARLDAAGQFSAESVSGGVKVELPGAPAAEFDLQSFSGEISNCAAQKATRSRYGPGSRLDFSTGDGTAHVHMSSMSGDLSLCAR